MLAATGRAKEATLSPARQELAAAIENIRSMEREASAHAEAFRKANSLYRSAVTAREEAQTALDEAPAATIAHLTASAYGEAGTPPLSVAKARAALAEAVETEEAAKSVLDAIKQQAQHASGSSLSSSRLKEAVAAVIRESAEFQNMVTELIEEERRLIEKAGPLAFLNSKSVLPENRESLNSPEYQAFRRMQTAPNTWDFWRDGPGGNAAEWAAAYEQLMTDASAPLPTGK